MIGSVSVPHDLSFPETPQLAHPTSDVIGLHLL